MNRESAGVELSCSACSWRKVYPAGEAGTAVVLPGESMPLNKKALQELLAGSGTSLVCPECRVPGVQVRPHFASDEDDWQQAVVCEICHRPIPPERLEALPGVRRCVACQDSAERNVQQAEPEYCPQCGSPLALRVARGGGIARYKLFCTGSPPCRL